MTYQPKSYRKFLATSVAAAMVATVAAPLAPTTVEAADAKFADVVADSYYSAGVDYLVEKGVLEGFPDGSFRPQEGVTRAQAAKILVETLSLEVPEEVELSFTDTKNDVWYSGYVAALVNAGIVEGNPDGTFAPNATISRAELAKMVVVANGLEQDMDAEIPFTDTVAGAWYEDYVNTLYSLGIVNGMTATAFAPNATVSRAQAAVFVHRTEVEEVRLEVPVKVVPVTELAVVSVSAINDRAIEIVFNKEVEGAADIEERRNRVAVYTNSLVNATQSDSIAFSADKKRATVTFATPFTFAIGQEYTIALIDSGNLFAANEIVKTKQVVINPVQNVITAPKDSDTTKKLFTVTFNRSMTGDALDRANYFVLDANGNRVGGTGATGVNVFEATEGGNDNPANFVADTTPTRSKLEWFVKAGVLEAGKSYRIFAANDVLASDGTSLKENTLVSTFTTPALSEVQPKVTASRIASDSTLEIYFDNSPNDRAGAGAAVAFVSALTEGSVDIFGKITDAQLSGGVLTITAAGGTFESGKTYNVSLNANLANNPAYTNARSAAVSNLSVQAVQNTKPVLNGVEIIRDSSNKQQANLLLKFDKQVKPSTVNALGAVKLKKLGASYDLKANQNITIYTGDSSGRTLIIRNINDVVADNSGSFDLLTSADFTAGTTFTVELAAGTIQVDSLSGSPATNDKTELTTAGIDVAQPKIKTLTYVSDKKVTVEFDRAVNISDLKASDITVYGFFKPTGSDYYEARPLSGAAFIKYSLSGNVLTIEPVNADNTKFQTGSVNGNNVVNIAANKIKDANGIKATSALNDTSAGAANIKDLAAPSIVFATTVNATTLNVTFTENVQFAGTTDEEKQFILSGAATDGVATAASITNNVIQLTFGGSNFAATNYKDAELRYARIWADRVQDTQTNPLNAEIQTHKGISHGGW